MYADHPKVEKSGMRTINDIAQGLPSNRLRQHINDDTLG